MEFFEYSNFDYSTWNRPEHHIVRDDLLRKTLYEKGFSTIENFIPEYLIKELRDHYNTNHSIEVDEGGFFVSIYSKDLSYRQDLHGYLLSKLQERFDSIFTDYKYTCFNYAAKYPGPEGELFIHQDMGQVDEFKYSQLGIWIPLEDVSIKNGTLCVIPHSHFLIPPHRSLYHELPYSKMYDLALDHVQPLSMNAGDLLLFDTRLLHNSFANQSTDPRLVIASSVVPKEAEFCMTYRDETFEKGEYELLSLADDFFLQFKDFKSEKVGKPGKSTGKFLTIKEEFVIEQEFLQFCEQHGISKNDFSSVRSAKTIRSIEEPVLKSVETPKKHFLERLRSLLN